MPTTGQKASAFLQLTWPRVEEFSMRPRPAGFALAALLALAWVQLLAGPTAWASSAPKLGAVITSPDLPGFTTAPAGPENGPLNASNADAFGASAGELLQQVQAGTVSGYIRTWIREPLNGDVIVCIAFWFSNASDENQFMLGAMNAATQSGSAFPVPGMAPAYGYSSKSAGGTPSLAIAFSKGDIAFGMTALNGGGDLTSDSLIQIAQNQYRAAPDISAPSVTASPLAVSTGSTPAGSAYGLGEILGSVLELTAICAGAVWIMRAVKRRRRRKEPVAPTASPVPAPPPSAYTPSQVPPSQPAGWYPIGDSPTEQRYWDGQSWSAQIRWDGHDWLPVQVDDRQRAQVF
jgi:hypothetical protein